ncbi:MAG: hypothetical protein A2X56_14655 [Nitrospirae bacterium GWC2_57_13]|jgi:hypothetical protein|nr:MAG: hypothetical protein A2X56_14655 [Nitrospirae bacterium GWC2_57_13]OGW46578.1 MAG: hypothetical protein A2X57_10485 [Nitrospirae bacterium GWD2_57_8]HAR45352.1 hypothetical protein [Nitrospiraceae bacterium]HAS52980.1 hypothetical protein [Nitrospiraceae bacterium]
MKGLFAVLVLSFSALLAAACAPKGPGIALPEVPSEGLVRALEQRRQAFPGLKAIARVQVVRKDRKRAFDTVGILLESQHRLRMEAYGPFGESLLALAWDGSDMQLLLAGETQPLRPGQFGLDRILGAGVQPAELCAILSGNIPASPGEETVKAYCGREGLCAVEFRSGDVARRAWLTGPAAGSDSVAAVSLYEVYRSGRLIYRARFEEPQILSHYVLPGKIIVENPDQRASLSVEYTDLELADQFPAGLFTLSGGEAPAP